MRNHIYVKKFKQINLILLKYNEICTHPPQNFTAQANRYYNLNTDTISHKYQIDT